VRRNEVDAGAGAASVATVEIAGPRQAPREVANQPAVIKWNLTRFAETLLPLMADGG